MILDFLKKTIKIAQYADDCILLLNDIDELCTAVSILDGFGTISGLQLNLSKSEGLWLRQDKNRQKGCSLVLNGLIRYDA